KKQQEESISLAASDLLEMRPSDASLDSLVSGLQQEHDPDALPSDKTNIVLNPLEVIQQLDQQVARNRDPSNPGGQAPAPSPRPTTPPAGTKFPDLPNMPTVVAEDGKAGLAPTAIARPLNRAIAQEAAAEGAPPPDPMPYVVRPSAPVITDYPVVPGGQRPFSADLAPSTPPISRPFATGQFDAAQAANLMSPVGDRFPQTDWERAAAMPARALPTWMLVALFGGALVGALLVTLVIAKIFS